MAYVVAETETNLSRIEVSLFLSDACDIPEPDRYLFLPASVLSFHLCFSSNYLAGLTFVAYCSRRATSATNWSLAIADQCMPVKFVSNLILIAVFTNCKTQGMMENAWLIFEQYFNSWLV